MILHAADLADIREIHEDERLIFTHGVYDLLHTGHVKHLEIAQSLGDICAVGVWSDACTAVRKGPGRPINTAEDRMEMLDALEVVDIVFEIPGIGLMPNRMRSVLSELQPDTYFIAQPSQNPLVDGAASMEHPSGRQTDIIVDPTYVDKVQSSTQLIAATQPSRVV